ncbi:MAG: acyl-CoA desaturase [Flavobacteriales bacterium]|nr:acyl-CoA desaturase [Flavobacteriales bacterium]NNK81192.1 acyl-CoA desaturase [Flavobacteriales bacterium]
MIVKTIVMLTVYLAPLILMLTGVVTNTWLVLFLWAVMGLGMSGIGMSVMHDANHGSYSKNSTVNKYIGYIMNLIGGHDKMWRLKHNVLHHTYTNIDGADEDIEVGNLFRFSPNQERHGIHRFQHIYAWPLYSLMSLMFATYADFTRAIRYKKNGVIRSESEFKRLMWDVSIWKVMYYLVILVLPMIVAPISPWITLLGFLIMHLVCGFLLSAIFQAAHVMPECEFPEPDEAGKMDAAWAVHQLNTTTNFAPKSKIFSWFIGGLNYQVEHHLFSNICHVHYPKLSKIVSETAKEFGHQYKVERSFVQALVSHARLLRDLGTKDNLAYA